MIGIVLHSCRCEDKDMTTSFKWPKDRRCREAKITSARMPFFAGAWQAIGAKDEEISSLKTYFGKLAKESCDEPEKYFGDLASAGQITTLIDAIDKRNIEVFGFDLEAAIIFRDEAFSLFREAFEKKCKPSYSTNFLELDSTSFESKFASIATGSCDSSSSGDQDVLGAGAVSSLGFNNSFRACIGEMIKNARKDDECVDPLAEGASSSSTPTAGECKSTAGCTEVTDSDGNVTKTETSKDANGNTVTKTTTTTKDELQTIKTTKTNPDGKTLFESTEVIENNSETGGVTYTYTSNTYNDDGTVTKTALTVITDESGNIVDKSSSSSCSGCKDDKGKKIIDTTAVVGGVAAGILTSVPVAVAAGVAAVVGIWYDEIFKNNKLCPSITPVENTTLPYLVSNFGDADFPNEPQEKQGLPTMLDSLNYCLCQASSGSLANLKCHSQEDKDRMECLRNPWGPDDAPRKECLDLLAEDNKELADRIKGKVCNVVYCPADSYLVVSNKAISGSTGPTYERSCSCLSKKVVAGQPLKNCNALNCGPDSYCDCSGFMCVCQSFGGGGISGVPGFSLPFLAPPVPIPSSFVIP